MLIQLNKKYRLKTVDEYNIALQTVKKSKDGTEYWTSVSFYGSLRDAFNSILDSARFTKSIRGKKEHILWMAGIKKISDQILGAWEKIEV